MNTFQWCKTQKRGARHTKKEVVKTQKSRQKHIFTVSFLVVHVSVWLAKTPKIPSKIVPNLFHHPSKNVSPQQNLLKHKLYFIHYLGTKS